MDVAEFCRDSRFSGILFDFFLFVGGFFPPSFPSVVLTAEDLAAFFKMSSIANCSLKIPGQVEPLAVKTPL